MTLILDALTLVFLAVGVLFFTAGTVGLIRFPDVRLRLHALTKADNLGLGFILLAVALQAPSPLVGGGHPRSLQPPPGETGYHCA